MKTIQIDEADDSQSLIDKIDSKIGAHPSRKARAKDDISAYTNAFIPPPLDSVEHIPEGIEDNVGSEIPFGPDWFTTSSFFWQDQSAEQHIQVQVENAYVEGSDDDLNSEISYGRDSVFSIPATITSLTSSSPGDSYDLFVRELVDFLWADRVL